VRNGISILSNYQPGESDNLNYESRLTTLSLQNLSWGSSVRRILSAALLSVEPGAAVERWMVRKGKALYVGGHEYPLHQYHRILLVGVGKAAVPMGTATAKILGSYFSKGILLTKEGHSRNLTGPNDLSGLIIMEGGHPLPDERGMNGARDISVLLRGAGEDDLVICLVSGGGSALMTSPAEGITLADHQVLTSILLACGATINEINILRKHLETLKGGALARLASPATLVTLILSDVVNDPLDVIASGPCVPDPSTYADALKVLEKYGISDQVPKSVLDHLNCGLRGEILETPKPGEDLFRHTRNVIVGSNRLAAEAARDQAKKENFNAMLLTTSMQGEASQVGRHLSSIAREIVASGKPLPRPACIIAGGETTVTIRGNGMGGRNQELALGAVDGLAGLEGIALVTLATDGGDGPTNAAGAVVTGASFDRARRFGLSPDDYLARNDAYHFFETLGDLLILGPTQTNVNDLALVFVR
jgi:glycerate 2-kinase